MSFYEEKNIRNSVLCKKNKTIEKWGNRRKTVYALFTLTNEYPHLGVFTYWIEKTPRWGY